MPTKRPTASGTKPTTPAAAPTLGATGPSPELVRATQNLLRILGYQVETNGILTPGTRTAVDLAQRQEKLTPTGVPNELLLVRLTERVTAHVKKRCG
ncbi:MAG: peptidoglycan-binding domain-containing protein [Thermoanaerobaculia bacterium]